MGIVRCQPAKTVDFHAKRRDRTQIQSVGILGAALASSPRCSDRAGDQARTTWSDKSSDIHVVIDPLFPLFVSD